MDDEKPKVDPKLVIRTEPVRIKQDGGEKERPNGPIKTKEDVEKLLKSKE